MMKNLLNYYQIIKEKLQSGDYTTSNPRDIDPHLEAINYLQWEFMSDRNGPIIDEVFSDICIPNGINQKDFDIDFSKYSVEEFLKEIIKLVTNLIREQKINEILK